MDSRELLVKFTDAAWAQEIGSLAGRLGALGLDSQSQPVYAPSLQSIASSH